MGSQTRADGNDPWISTIFDYTRAQYYNSKGDGYGIIATDRSKLKYANCIALSQLDPSFKEIRKATNFALLDKEIFVYRYINRDAIMDGCQNKYRDLCGGVSMDIIDLSKIAFNRKNLKGLLGVLEKDENIFTHVEFANWCGGYWSEWRRADDLYYSTDEQTINVVDSIFYYFVKYKIDRFEEVKIKEWIQMLNGNDGRNKS